MIWPVAESNMLVMNFGCSPHFKQFGEIGFDRPGIRSPLKQGGSVQNSQSPMERRNRAVMGLTIQCEPGSRYRNDPQSIILGFNASRNRTRRSARFRYAFACFSNCSLITGLVIGSQALELARVLKVLGKSLHAKEADPTLAVVVHPSTSRLPAVTSEGRGSRNQCTGTCAGLFCRRVAALESYRPRSRGKSVGWLGPWVPFCGRFRISSILKSKGTTAKIKRGH
jgi:hypothetical protein